jgi:hypothetical protein
MGRLIDESEAIELIKGSDELTDYQKHESITCIRACNTAYDPDKVVQQQRNILNQLAKEERKAYAMAIKITKAGGVKALSDTQQPTTGK